MNQLNSVQSPGRVLLVEDDESIRELTAEYFVKEGYTVFQAGCAEDADKIIAEHDIELMVADIQLPGEDGLSLIRRVRANSDMGIFLITKKSELMERVIGIEMGADLYIVKPFDFRELLAYTKGMIRRVRGFSKSKKAKNNQLEIKSIHFNGVTLLPNEREIISGNSSCGNPSHREQLTRDEFFLLMVFLNNPKQVLSRDALIDAIHGSSYIANDRAIDVLVRRLRKKIQDDSSATEIIASIYGEGYIFKAEAEFD